MSECKFKTADGECLREREFPYKEYCVDGPCTHYTSITNADRIRAMTDEELAEYLDGVCHDLWQMFVKDPQKMWLDWLKQEADDELLN